MTNTIAQIVDIAAALAPEGSTVTAASSIDDLQLDSLECLVLTAEIEDRFDVEIHCGERVSCDTLADLARVVDSRLRVELPLAA